jgi:ornithine cyclodeaminase
MQLEQAPLWIAEAETVSLIDLGEAISQVRDALVAQASGAGANMAKAQVSWPGGALHATGATLHAKGYVGSKTWAYTPSGASPIVLLWRISDGRLLAVLEAFALGQYRTSAVTGVATDRCASAQSTVMAVCGTGSQALMQVAAVNAVRAIQTVRVWSPRAASRDVFCRLVSDSLGIDTVNASSPEAAVDGASIVTLVTRSTTPFLSPSSLDRGTHVNALGAIGLERAEFEPALLGRADLVVVDDVLSAQKFSREFREYFGHAEEGWQRVERLADVVAAPVARAETTDISLFKAMGAGIADLALAVFVYEQAVVNGLGTPLPMPSHSRPRMRASLDRPGAGYV